MILNFFITWPWVSFVSHHSPTWVFDTRQGCQSLPVEASCSPRSKATSYVLPETHLTPHLGQMSCKKCTFSSRPTPTIPCFYQSRKGRTKFEAGRESLYTKRLQDYVYKLETKGNRLNWDQAKCIDLGILIWDLGLKAVAYAAGSGPNSLLGCWLEPSPPAITITITRSSKSQG